MYVCLYVCIYVCMYVCMYVRMYVYRSVLLKFAWQPILGDIARVYETLCEMEIAQAAKNPENKGVFADVTSKIRDLCARFTNQQTKCKTHLKKRTAKAKGGAKRGARPKREEDADE